MGAIWTQFVPPRPNLTEKNLPSLAGKIFIVTGGNAGIGLDVVKILYSKGGTVYVAGRSPNRVAAAIEEVKSIPTDTPGQLKSLHLDLNDLTTVAPCAAKFLEQESRLDVLFNNAGVSHMPLGSTSAQGFEQHMGCNCLGPYLFTKLLLPTLIKTAKSAPKDSVRVVWTSSSIVDMAGPPGGVSLAEQAPGKAAKDVSHNYAASKAGNWLLGSELERRNRESGIVSVTQNPGNLKSKAWDNVPFFVRFVMKPFMYDAKMGAYTELWTAFSPEVKCGDGQKFGIPWGRWHPNPKKDVVESLKSKGEGGTGLAAEFWDWCDEQTKPYAGN